VSRAATVRAATEVAGVHQHFEPFAEAIDVELPVASRPRGTPQIEVEQGGELRGSRCRDELAARIESTVANELMQGFRREVRTTRAKNGVSNNRSSRFSTEPPSPGGVARFVILDMGRG
jgi:hypothetical protein